MHFPSLNILKAATSSSAPNVVAHAPAEKGKIELYSPMYYAVGGVGGVFSCGLTHTAIVPLDVVKTRLQTHPGKYKGMFDGARTMLRTEGAKSLTLGWQPTALGYSMQGACKFGFYELFKKKFSDAAGPENAVKYRTGIYLAGSACAEFIADIALCPMEAMRIRMVANPDFAAKGLAGAVNEVKLNEGIGGFYKGLAPIMLKQIPYTMVKFATFERTAEALYGMISKPKSEMSKAEKLGVTFAAGYIAGVFCAVISHPADTVLSKINQVKTDKGALAAIKIIVDDLGFSGLWLGLGARIVMIGTLTGLQWFIYDSFKVMAGLPVTGGKK